MCYAWAARVLPVHFGGLVPVESAELLRVPVDGQNPRARAKRMKTPTLVIHGLLDYRVPDSQGLQYYNTLKEKGVPSRLVFFPDENHWILKPQNSRLWYREFFAWLKRHVATGGKSRKR